MNSALQMFPYDFRYLWVAGKMSLSGENVYDLSLFATRMYEYGWASDEGVWGFPHPPYLFWLYAPLGLVSLQVAIYLWLLALALQVLLLGRLSQNLSSRLPDIGGNLPPGLLWFALLSFIPSIKIIVFGQVSFILAIGLTLAILLYQQKKDFYSGLALSLVLIKPHLVFAFILAWTLRSIIQKRFLFPFGVIGGVLIQFSISYLWYPEGFIFYPEAIIEISKRAPELSGTTLNQILNNLFDIKGLAFPIWISSWLIGIILAVKHNIPFPTLIHILIPLSLISAPYCFSHDLILLLPTYLVILSLLYHQIGESVKYVCLIVGGLGALVIAMINYEYLVIIIPLSCLIFTVQSYKGAAGPESLNPINPKGNSLFDGRILLDSRIDKRTKPRRRN